MGFDPLSWAIGFVATAATKTIAEKFFSKELSARLASAAKAWESGLPTEARTPAEAIFAGVAFDQHGELGQARRNLQTIVLERGNAPTAKDWLSALVEHWEDRRTALGVDANQFFRLEPAQAHAHLSALAHQFESIARTDPALFRGTVIDNLDAIMASQDQLTLITQGVRTDSDELRRLLLNLDKTVRALAVPLSPHALDVAHITVPALCFVNQVSCVDTPTARITGRLRTHSIWVGAEGVDELGANFVPLPPTQVATALDDLTARWNQDYSGIKSAEFETKVAALANFHHELLRIHPFEDGNGRVARVLLDFQCGGVLGTHRALAIRNRPDYLKSLRAADRENREPLIKLLANVIRTELFAE